MKQQVHFHLVYVGQDQFQLTVTHVNKPRTPLVEIMTFSILERSIQQMKLGAKSIVIGTITIDCNRDVVELREYFQMVYGTYVQAKSEGRDLDAELKEIENHPDPTYGSGDFSLN